MVPCRQMQKIVAHNSRTFEASIGTTVKDDGRHPRELLEGVILFELSPVPGRLGDRIVFLATPLRV
jgi:hypothetical protein